MRQFSDMFAMKHAQTLAAGYLLLPKLSPSAATNAVHSGFAFAARPANAPHALYAHVERVPVPSTQPTRHGRSTRPHSHSLGHWPGRYRGVSSMAEQRTFNPWVLGSSPRRPAKLVIARTGSSVGRALCDCRGPPGTCCWFAAGRCGMRKTGTLRSAAVILIWAMRASIRALRWLWLPDATMSAM